MKTLPFKTMVLALILLQGPLGSMAWGEVKTSEQQAKEQAELAANKAVPPYVQAGVTEMSWVRTSEMEVRAKYRLGVDAAKYPGEASKKFTVRVVDAKQDGKDATRLKSGEAAAAIPILEDIEPGVMGLTLTFTDMAAQGGDIEAVVLLVPLPVAGAAAPPPQRLKLTVKAVKAKLSVPTNAQHVGLRLERTLWVWGQDTSNDPSTPALLHVSETTGETAMGVTVLEDITAVAGATQNNTGVVEFYASEAGSEKENETGNKAGQPTAYTIPGNGDLLLTPRLKGSFELGETTGKVRVKGGNVAEETEFAYTLKVKICAIWIPILSLVGVFLGWVVRIRLPEQAAAASARVRGLLLLQQLSSQGVPFSPDAQYLGALKGIVLDLQTSLGQPAILAADLTKDIDAAEARHKAALQVLDTAVKEQKKAVEDWMAVADKEWNLPEWVRPLWLQVRQELRLALELVQQRDPQKARAALEQLQKDRLNTLVRTSAEWRLGLATLLPILTQAAPPTHMEDLAPLEQLLTKATVGEDLKAARERASEVEMKDVSVLEDELKRANDLWHWTKDVAGALRGAVEDFCTAVAEAVRTSSTAQASTPDVLAEAARQLEEAGGTFASSLGDVLKTGQPGLDGVRMAREQVRRLEQAWTAALLPLTGGDAKKADAVRQQVLKHQWVVAVAATDVIASSDGARDVKENSMSRELGGAPEVPAGSTAEVVLTPWPKAEIATLIAQHMQSAHAKEQLRSLIVGAMFALLALIFMKENWVGTLPEVGRLLLAAFLTDLGVDKLKPLAGSTPLPF